MGWPDLAVVPLVVVLSVPPLLWFAQHWTVLGNDAGRYLLAGSQFVSGQAMENVNNISQFNGGHGPGLPALIGALIFLFGHETTKLVWAVRLLALLDPLLAYFLGKRISGPVAGLIAAALVALFGYNVKATVAINIDAPMLTFYLLALLALLAAIERNSALLATLSGVLLGASILIKETAFANLPLALVAVLLLDWNLRGALWHYLGVVLVSLPWWIWAYSATGEVYLVDRLPDGLQVPILVAAGLFLILAFVAYATGLLARFLADERRRRWSGWFVVLAWTLILSGMLLATADEALGRLSFQTLRLYLARLLKPDFFVVPALLVTVGYTIWKVVRQDGAWKLFALALLFQVPVCLLVTVERWAPRQFLIPQTLLFCALAALIVAAGETALRGRGYYGPLRGAVVAAALAVFMVAASVERVQALLPENPSDALSGQQTVAPQEAEMIHWMAKNVDRGEHILIVSEPAINVSQANYLMFLDAGRHKWTRLQLDQGICQPRPNVQIRCNPEENAVSRIPPDAIWVQRIGGRCRVISLSMSNLLKQADQSHARYLMIAGSPIYPTILQLSSPLQRSNAFELAHAELARSGYSGVEYGSVLLKTTGRTPIELPPQMNAATRLSLNRCRQFRPGHK